MFLESGYMNEEKHCGSYRCTFAQAVSSAQNGFSNPANPSKPRQNTFYIFREPFSNHWRPQSYLYISSTCSVSGSRCWSISSEGDRQRIFLLIIILIINVQTNKPDNTDSDIAGVRSVS